ncbi:MAG TPA: MerR family transcriptional regulator [Candidatus Eisenbacteria bacterium]|nr:MerR family transcriptional regulator [Candidatus Eisenbacteria bacterium]
MAATDTEVDAKLYRSISEVSGLVDVKPHVLRYWETQFSMLRPRKNRAGNRMYRPDEVRLVLRIKEYLYERRYTIAGARRRLLDERRGAAATATSAAEALPVTGAATAAQRRAIAEVREELAALLARLRADVRVGA